MDTKCNTITINDVDIILEIYLIKLVFFIQIRIYAILLLLSQCIIILGKSKQYLMLFSYFMVQGNNMRTIFKACIFRVLLCIKEEYIHMR